MNSWIAFGLTQLFRGARRGQALTAGFGAAVALLGLAKRRAQPARRRVYAANLKPGQGITVRFDRDDERTGG